MGNIHRLAARRPEGSRLEANDRPALAWLAMPGHARSYPPSLPGPPTKEDRIGLRMKGRLSLDTVRGAEARALAIDGALGLSIGFVTRDAGFEKRRRVLKDVQLFEVSLVAIPANPQAKLTSVKSAVGDTELTPRMLERLLCAGGVPQRFAKALLAGGWRVAARCDDAEAVDALIRDMRANTKVIRSLLRT